MTLPTLAFNIGLWATVILFALFVWLDGRNLGD